WRSPAFGGSLADRHGRVKNGLRPSRLQSATRGLNSTQQFGVPPPMSEHTNPGWHGTTIVSVRKGNKVVVAGDGQVSMGPTVMKHGAKKVRRLAGGKVIGGFAGSTADAFTLFERLEAKLEQYPDQLMRAAVELAKDWRTDRYLRKLEAMMIVADTRSEER